MRIPPTSSSLVASILVASLLAPAVGLADDNDDALAESLFNRGRELTKKGDVAGACAAFEESEKLGPGHAGNIANLAVCHEQLKKWAASWVEYETTLRLAKKANNAERIKIATDGLARLQKELSHVTIDVAEEPEGLEVTWDGKPLAKVAWSTQIPVDPGDHVLAAVAPKKKRWESKVSIGEVAEVKKLSVPKLEDAPDAPVPPPVAVASNDTPATPAPAQDKPATHDSTLATAGWITGAAGLGVVAIGGYLTIHAGKNADDARADYKAGTIAGSDANGRIDSAKSLHTWGLVTAGVGVAAMGAGVWMILTGTKTSMPPTAGAVTVSPTLGGLSIQGVFQ